jgi:hypothetical protein
LLCRLHLTSLPQPHVPSGMLQQQIHKPVLGLRW